jgi:hypothetical protein
MKLISILATHRWLYRVTSLGRTTRGDIYGPKGRDLGIIGQERSRCVCRCELDLPAIAVET